MITLCTFGPMFGLPDASPFVTKAEMLLKMSGLPYDKDTKGYAKAPKGKLPYIRDGGRIVADSTFIRLYLEQQHSIDFDKHLSTRERGTAWMIEKMCEDHLYWLFVHFRWMDDANFEKGPAHFFSSVPAPLRGIVKRVVRGKLRKTLHAQGTGRHSPEEIAQLGARAIDALAAAVGDGPYLMGANKCGADATVFSFVLGTLCPLFDSPLRAAAERNASLVGYAERMTREFYPELVGAGRP